MHRGDYVDVPRHEGSAVPHWSRWERGATSFGPTGRIVATAAVLAVTVATFMSAFFIAFLGMVMADLVLLQDIWKKDWIVPAEPRRPALPVASPAEDEHRPPRTPVQQGFRWLGWTATVLLGAAFAYGPIPAKATALAGLTVIGFVWFVRGFLSR
jgi:hypothetical protein